jgi:glycerophosphoryl diester phosphodiesterase
METKILWCDEISEKWYGQKIITKMHKNNKIIYGMSLEVVKTCNESEVLVEWKRLIDLGIDGICTKFPEKLMKFVREGDLN